MARLDITGVSKSFGANTVLQDVSMTVEDGEFVAVLGPSGCGKTTMLRLVAGFDRVSAGSISLADRVVSAKDSHMPPEDRRMGIVFQSYALWPHMDVAENVAYALRVQRVPAAEREQRVAKALSTVGLTEFRTRRPAMLSGGQRQRVALARCLAMQPDIVLLDEPLANLDVHLRSSMEEEFASFHKRTGTTMFYITHDQAEAMALADRIAVMDKGRILQMATPSVLYREPANAMVACFIGAGMLLDCQVDGQPSTGRIAVTVMGVRVAVRCANVPASGRGQLCVRAGDLALANGKAEGFPARIERMIYQGGHYLAHLSTEGATPTHLQIQLQEPCHHSVGDVVRIAINDGWLIPQLP